MGFEHILYEASGRVATVTLNRPAKLNAWTSVMEVEVRRAMEEAARDEAVRVIVLTGAGRGFCAGADMDLLAGITEGARPGDGQAPRPVDGVPRPEFAGKYAYFPTVPKPIIGAINGACAGLGLVVALYCDMRFASDQAVFTTAFARRGLIAEHGVSWLLPHLVGPANALDLLLSARKFDAAEALRVGLVNQVWPQAGFASAVRAYADELATLSSPRSLAVMKRQLWDAQFQTLAEATRVADEEMLRSFTSEDFKEGVAHFVQKRPPAFTGR